eukprot:m51a1_g10440 putative alanyl-trna synthetase (883) ;mRNA; f:20137-23820
MSTGKVPRTSAEIRESFIKFFESKGHLFVRSAPVVPQDDPTLMFINAGMNQFKGCMLGENPKGWKRVANSQKCIRVSGKHNDLDEVGRDTYHHTLFEMLGNWSFGDYYKEEALAWSWELLTQVWQLPKDRLFVTVFEDDDESAEIWARVSGLPKERIMKFGAKSNFWEMGDTGPCGPCSEIHFDKGDLATQAETFADPIKGVNGTNDRYIEIWNNVFMQYERVKSGELIPLKSKNVDTGMGFERVCAILQNVRSNYDTDVFSPIIAKIAELSGVPYGQGPEGMPHRVVADHLRALSFAIADGALPSNEGRGYVLRRILRRASRYARLLGQKDEAFVYKLVPTLQKIMGAAFPEIRERGQFVADVIRSEEERFIKTLGSGIDKFEKFAAEAQSAGSSVIPGDKVFLLYDTFGFPADLTRILAEEKSMTVDEDGFQRLMTEQRERARANKKAILSAGGSDGWTIYEEGTTEFVGYDLPSCESKVLRWREDAGLLSVVLDRTPFYAECGGQVGERGRLESSGIVLEVADTIKVNDIWIHRARVVSGAATQETMSQVFVAQVDEAERAATRRNHSATHLLQAALQRIVGSRVAQQGSRVAWDVLRFDFTASSPLTPEQLQRTEALVNEQVMTVLPVTCDKMALADAQATGAMALFGEKYGDVVRVISMGEFSKELCGGLHVSNTGEIGYFRILSESSISSGVRRIEAVSGMGALAKAREDAAIVSGLRMKLCCKDDELIPRLDATAAETKRLEKELVAVKAQLAALRAAEMLARPAAQLKGVNVWTIEQQVPQADFTLLVDAVAAAQPQGVVLLVNTQPTMGSISVVVCKALSKKAKAGAIVKKLAEVAGGNGGGSPERAQAGTKTPEKIADVVAASARIIEELLP